MKKFLVVLVLGMVALSACKKEPPPPPPKPPPPPPSAEKLYDEAKKELDPLLTPVGASHPGAVKGALQTIQGKLRAQENGEKALMKIENDFKERMVNAFQAEQWDMVIVLSEGVEFFEPGSSRTQRYREIAMAEKNRPEVTVKGFYTDEETGALIVFLDVWLPAQKKMESVRVRVGDEFHNLRLERIIGKNSAIEVRYLKTNKLYTIKGPGRSL